ncbi:MAG: siroheme synthase CysG [Pseudomonadota bacterium]
MKHFPIFVALEGRRIVLAGGGEAALAKLRLILKTEADVTVFAARADTEIHDWHKEGRLTLVQRPLAPGDVTGAVLFYAADEDALEDARTSEIAQSEGALVNIVDNLADSAFITPAIVDRDPVTVAIGTEGAAPVLARAIKADIEARLPATLGVLARVGKAFRHAVEVLPFGRPRRDFWREYYFQAGPRAIEEQGQDGINIALESLLEKHKNTDAREGHVAFVGAGPGDPELLTLKARKLLDEADVVIHDRLVSPEILELARREAMLIDAGKKGFGPSTAQSQINDMIVEYGLAGEQVVRLKGGDPTLFARLDEEIGALEGAGVNWNIVPGITAASAASAAIGQSLTERGRNSSVRFMTGHDMKGFAEHDWRELAKPGAVASVYMGKRSARFVQGRMLMYGAARDVPITVIENATRPDQRVVTTRLDRFSQDLEDAQLTGAALTIIGLKPRAAQSLVSEAKQDVVELA